MCSGCVLVSFLTSPSRVQDRDLIQKLPEGAAKAEAELRIAVNGAATALQVKKIITASLSELQKNVALLQLNEHAIPLVHQFVITSRSAVIHMEDKDLARWSACFDFSMPDAADECWEVKTPTFRTCLNSLSTLQDPLIAEDEQKCVEAYVNAAVP